MEDNIVIPKIPTMAQFSGLFNIKNNVNEKKMYPIKPLKSISFENSQTHNKPNKEVKVIYDSFEKRIADKNIKT